MIVELSAMVVRVHVLEAWPLDLEKTAPVAAPGVV
jgi:hypothetical protein